MKNIKIRNLNIIILSLLISSGSIVSSVAKNNNSEEKQASLEVYDTFTGLKSIHLLNSNDAMEIIDFFNDDFKKDSFSMEIKDRIILLEELGIVSSNTARILIDNFDLRQKYGNRESPLALFDVFNFFNGIFFGVKGERTFNQLDLPVYRYPFFNTTMTALFSLYSTFVGRSSVFTIGTLGFKNIHDFNMTKYDFPHLPELKGTVVGFTGILIKVIMGDDFGEEYAGTYFIGAGMTVLTIWNNQEV